MRVLYVHYDTEPDIPDDVQLGDKLVGIIHLKVTDISRSIQDDEQVETTAEVFAEISELRRS